MSKNYILSVWIGPSWGGGNFEHPNSLVIVVSRMIIITMLTNGEKYRKMMPQ